MPKLTEYEIERQKKIEENRKLLESLGLGNTKAILGARPKPPPKPKAKVKAKIERPAKRKSIPGEEEDEENDAGADIDASERPKKSARVDEGKENEEATGPVRRSQRNVGKKVDYNGVEQDRSANMYRISKAKGTMGSDPRDVNRRSQDPKQYGSIPGVEVGSWWETRQACSADAIHAPWVGGISCGPKGAYSVALSGGYDDDVDLGNGFTFTGSGGRDLKGTKEKPKNLRTAPQSSDQTFENNFNKALKKSAETRNPVRVIRGYKLDSPYAPAEGYRYDGLYIVEKSWQERGLNSKGYLVCKFAFKRIDGQPPLPTRDADAESEEETSSEAEDDDQTADGEVDDGEEEDDETRVSTTQNTDTSATLADEDA